MKRLNKSSISSLICAIVMLFSLCMILGVKSEAAAKKPSITKSVTIFRNSGTRIIGVDNMKKGDKITKVYPKNNDYNAIGAWTGERSDEIMISALNVSKTGSTKVYVKVQRGKKTYKLSMKVNVIPYTCPMQSAKIGKTNVKKAITNTADAFLKNNSECLFFGFFDAFVSYAAVTATFFPVSLILHHAHTIKQLIPAAFNFFSVFSAFLRSV